MQEQERDRTDYADGAISVRPYLDALKRYQAVILAALAGVSVLFVIGVLAMLVTFPAERIATLPFRLLFEGAAQNQYPNKTPFNPTEIVGVPVVTEVFKANDLQRYGDFPGFKDALFVQNSSPGLELLYAEYQSRLADTKLTAVDRSRIEAEFSQRRDTLRDPFFSLTLHRSDRFQALPDELAQKVLNDTLAVWAVQAERMGALKYDLPLLSSGVLSKESLDNEDYLVGVDQLRAKTVRIIDTLAELEKLPGALTTRTAKDKISLPEIRANIEDAVRFQLAPLLAIIRSEGITKNARHLSLYASAQLLQRQLDRQAAEGRVRALQNSLADYMTPRGARAGAETKPSAGATGYDSPPVIPQITDTFLGRLVDMTSPTQKDEMKYRQKLTDEVIKENIELTLLDKELAYYQDLTKSLQGTGSRPTGSPELIALVKSRSQAAFSAIAKGADQLVDLYNELSAKNLNAATRLYAVTGPFARHTQSSVSFRWLLYAYLLIFLSVAIAVPAGCLVYDSMKRRRAA